MFSFGLFSTHIPFIVIGIVSFVSMAYAYLNPLAFVEKTEQISITHDVEINEINKESSIDFFDANDSFNAFIDNQDKEDKKIPFVVFSLFPKPDKPLLGGFHSFPFIARPPPFLS
jgi:hypothetical protein